MHNSITALAQVVPATAETEEEVALSSKESDVSEVSNDLVLTETAEEQLDTQPAPKKKKT